MIGYIKENINNTHYQTEKPSLIEIQNALRYPICQRTFRMFLLHENERTVSCLNDIITILKKRGYDIRPITDDIKPKNFW